jgi:hypothetical protein
MQGPKRVFNKASQSSPVVEKSHHRRQDGVDWRDDAVAGGCDDGAGHGPRSPEHMTVRRGSSAYGSSCWRTLASLHTESSSLGPEVVNAGTGVSRMPLMGFCDRSSTWSCRLFGPCLDP